MEEISFKTDWNNNWDHRRPADCDRRRIDIWCIYYWDWLTIYHRISLRTDWHIAFFVIYNSTSDWRRIDI